MNKIDIKDLSRSELEAELARLGEPPYKAAQIFNGLYRSGAKSFDDMTTLSLALRKKLKDNFHITRTVLLDLRSSRVDGTTKYLLKLEDGNTIECVFLPACNRYACGQAGLPEAKRNTVCLSSQVGCKFACSFCASSAFGFVRNLKFSEMIDEVLFLRSKNPSSAITNLVFMGIGEPLDNYDNVLKAIRIFNDKDAFGIGARRITISTCGLIPGIERLIKEKIQIELSISLHSADDRTRSRIVPVNKRYPLGDLIKASRDYIEKTGRMITFEYVLLKGINDSAGDVRMLSRLLRGMNVKVNVITYNLVTAKGHEAPSSGGAALFAASLKKEGLNAFRRKPKGLDIDAGCGQLRISRL